MAAPIKYMYKVVLHGLWLTIINLYSNLLENQLNSSRLHFHMLPFF